MLLVVDIDRFGVCCLFKMGLVTKESENHDCDLAKIRFVFYFCGGVIGCNLENDRVIKMISILLGVMKSKIEMILSHKRELHFAKFLYLSYATLL